MIRYADDFVCCFEFEEDAKMFYKDLIERLGKFGLEISESKSKITPFGRNTDSKETFDFLGFTHRNGKGRTGYYKLIHHTCQKKSKAKKEAIKAWLKVNVWRYNMYEVIRRLNTKLNGMFRYYGISDNSRWMNAIRYYVIGELRRCLNRRSQKGKLSWIKFQKILKYNPIALPKIYHPLW
jgi:hypothetical protein